MKRTFILLLALVMCLSLAACGGNNTPSTQETPAETTVPETTAEPEPVYETIELTAENFLQYFEIMYKPYFSSDPFGEVTGLEISSIITIKEEFAEKIDTSNFDCVVELSVVQQKSSITVDLKNQTYTIGEVQQERTVTRLYNFASAFCFEVFEKGVNVNHTSPEDKCIVKVDSDAPYVILLSTDPADCEILRIQGKITIQTN